MRRLSSLAVLLVTLAGSLSAQAKQFRPTGGLDLAGMDRTVQPGDSFYQYANGNWLKHTDIPSDRSYWGPDGVLSELTDKRTADLIQEIAKSNAADGSDRQKIRDYYASFLDTAAIARAGLTPLKPALDSIAGIADRKALSRYLGTTLRADVEIGRAHV